MFLDALGSTELRYLCVTKGLSGLFSALGAALLLAIKGSGRSVCIALWKGSRQLPSYHSHRCTLLIPLGLCVCTTIMKLLQLGNWLILWRMPSVFPVKKFWHPTFTENSFSIWWRNFCMILIIYMYLKYCLSNR